MNNGMFNQYISKKFKGNVISHQELKAIKEGDIPSMVKSFLNLKNEQYQKQLISAFDSMDHYIGNDVILEDFTQRSEVDCKILACQVMDGDQNIFMGIGGEERGILEAASIFAKERFEDLDAEAYDSICEFVNCINGAFATQLSEEDVNVTMRPPVFYENRQIKAESGFYILTLKIAGNIVEIITAIDENITL